MDTMNTLDIADIGLLATFAGTKTVCPSDIYAAYKRVGIGRDAARTRLNKLIEQGLINIEVERHAGRFAGRVIELLTPAFELLGGLFPMFQPAPAGTAPVDLPSWQDNHDGSPDARNQAPVKASNGQEIGKNDEAPSRVRARAEISLSLSGNSVNSSLPLDLRGESERGNDFSEGEKDPEAQRRKLQHQAMLVEMSERTGKPLEELIAIYGREPKPGKTPPSSAAPPKPMEKTASVPVAKSQKPSTASGMSSVGDRVKAIAAGLFQPRAAEADEKARVAEERERIAQEKAKELERQTRRANSVQYKPANEPSSEVYALPPSDLLNRLYSECIKNPTPEKDAPYLPRLANWLAANDSKEVRLKVWHAFKFAAKCGAKTLVFAENNMRNKQQLALTWGKA